MSEDTLEAMRMPTGRVPYTGGNEDVYRQSILHWRQ